MSYKCDGEGHVWTKKPDGQTDCMSCQGCPACCPTGMEQIVANMESAPCMDDMSYEEIALAARCIKLVRDISKAGVRFDLNPTVSYGQGQRHKDVYSWFLEYVKRIDDSMKEKAAKALSGKVEQSVGYVAAAIEEPSIKKGCACGINAGSGIQPCVLCEDWICSACGQAHNETKHSTFKL